MNPKDQKTLETLRKEYAEAEAEATLSWCGHSFHDERYAVRERFIAARKLLVIAETEGIQAALLWKLANGGS